MRTSLWIRFLSLVAPRLLDWYLRFVEWTSRKTVVNEEVDESDQRPMLGAGWHQGLVYLMQHFRDRNGVMMVSRNRIGSVVTAVIERLGWRPVRGGSSPKPRSRDYSRYRYGKEALAEMVHLCGTEGLSGGLVCDGPRGPYGEAKIGIILLARDTGLPLVPVAWWCSKRLMLRTWDRTLIPLPFGRIHVIYGDPMVVPASASETECERLRVLLSERLMALTFQAQEALGERRLDCRSRPSSRSSVQVGSQHSVRIE